MSDSPPLSEPASIVASAAAAESSAAASSKTAAPNTTNTARSKMLLLGDSLTQLCYEGWGSKLADRYQRRADVLNRGMSGYNTRWFLKYAEESGVWTECQPASAVSLITIFFGANDAALPDEGSKRQHVPVPEYKTNLTQMIDVATKSYPNAHVIVITPPPVHEEQRLKYQKTRYGDKATGVAERSTEHTSQYATACCEVVEEWNNNNKDQEDQHEQEGEEDPSEKKKESPSNGEKESNGEEEAATTSSSSTKGSGSVTLLDLFDSMMNSDGVGNIEQYFCDGLHFSKRGHAFAYEKLVGLIQNDPLLEEALHVTPCPNTYQFNNSASKCSVSSSGPYHDEIVDPDHPYNNGSAASESSTNNDETKE